MMGKVLALALLAAPFAFIALTLWGLQADHDRDDT
jgi:hypothetical protein